MQNEPTVLTRLLEQFPTAKRTTLKQMVAAGSVSVNGRRATRLNQPVGEADRVTVGRAPEPRPQDPRQLIAPLTIVFEDEDILVIDKPAGFLTSTTVGEKRPTALAAVRRYLTATAPKARLGLIHRLDRDAGGLLVFSKSDRAYQSLKTQFFKHTVERVYEATVRGKPNPPSGRIESRLLERADGTVYSTDEHAKGQRAITDYETVRHEAGQSVLRVKLLTGRKHQIRAHLSERGCPIVGDTVYGRSLEERGKRPASRAAKRGAAAAAEQPLMLRAVVLSFDHPQTGERVSFNSPRRGETPEKTAANKGVPRG
jgi:23S rRNA pseudouridine1911/1915/1917 synthase